jgi:O-antigen/teichoic acid export membrane protein
MIDATGASQPGLSSTGQPQLANGQQSVLEVAKGGGLVLVGETTSRFVTYLYSFVLCRTIGVESFGVLTVGLTTINIVSALATLGLNQGIVRFGAVYARDAQKGRLRDVLIKSIGMSLGASIVLSLGLLAFAQGLANRAFHVASLAPVLVMLAATLPLASSRSVFLAATQAFKVTWMLTLVEKLFLPVCTLVLTAVCVAASLALGAVVMAQLASSALATLLALYLLWRLLPAPWNGRETSVSRATLLKFSLPLSLVALIQFSYERTETVFLGVMTSMSSVGVYNIALRTAGFELLFAYSLSVIFSPFISDLYESRAVAELERLYKLTAKWSFTGGLAIFMVFVMYARPIMELFGSDFGPGAVALLILGIGQLVNAGMGQAGYVLVMTGRSGMVLANTIVLLLLSVVLDLALIPRYGLLGAAIAGSLAIALFSVLRVVEVYALLKMHPFQRSLWKPALAGLGAVLVAYPLRLALPSGRDTLSLFVGAPVFLALFVVLIYKLGLDSEDQLVMLALQRKMRQLLRPSAGKRARAKEDFGTGVSPDVRRPTG